MDTWVFATDESQWAGMLAAVRGLGGRVTAAVVGSRELADAVAATGPDAVLWVEPPPDAPAEAFAPALAAAAEQARPRVLVSTADPAARALLGSACGRLGAALIPGMIDMAAQGDEVIVRRWAIGGEVAETYAVAGPIAAVFAGEDVESAPGRAAEVATLDVPPTDMSVVRSVPTTVATGVNDAARVVAFGRGVQAKGDMALIERLAAALGAEVACSMPIADDLHWMDKARYIGRSGQHIAPALYLAIGIAGAPQHMEGVRDARIVVAINNDPGAPVFRLCPAHVYTEEPDGTLSVAHAACMECGTCLAVAAPGSLTWHYPRGGFGVAFREG